MSLSLFFLNFFFINIKIRNRVTLDICLYERTACNLVILSWLKVFVFNLFPWTLFILDDSLMAQRSNIGVVMFFDYSNFVSLICEV